MEDNQDNFQELWLHKVQEDNLQEQGHRCLELEHSRLELVHSSLEQGHSLQGLEDILQVQGQIHLKVVQILLVQVKGDIHKMWVWENTRWEEVGILSNLQEREQDKENIRDILQIHLEQVGSPYTLIRYKLFLLLFLCIK